MVEIPLDPSIEGIVGSEKKMFLARVNNFNGEEQKKIKGNLSERSYEQTQGGNFSAS